MATSRSELFLELLTRHESQLFGYLFALVRNMDDAEDLYQQMLLTAWEKFDQFDPATSFNAWATQIARYKALNFLQSKQNQKLSLSEHIVGTLADRQSEEEAEVRLARKQALAGCMRKLNDKDRRLIELCYSSELPIGTVAQQIGRPAAGVYNSLSRIRGSLFRCIERTLEQEEAG